MTQADLAEAVGVERNTVSRWALARVPRQREVLDRLARVLEVAPEWLLGEEERGQWEPEPDAPDEGPSAQGVELEEYVANMDRIVRTLRSVSGGPLSIPIKLALLDGIKGAAADAGATLPREFFEIRRRVLAGEL